DPTRAREARQWCGSEPEPTRERREVVTANAHAQASAHITGELSERTACGQRDELCRRVELEMVLARVQRAHRGAHFEWTRCESRYPQQVPELLDSVTAQGHGQVAARKPVDTFDGPVRAEGAVGQLQRRIVYFEQRPGATQRRRQVEWI